MSTRDNILTGFLPDRDKDSFVYADTENRLGWEDDLGKDDAYSVFSLGREEYSDKRKHQLAHKSAKNAISVMDLPYKVNVAFTPEDNFFDGKTIHVGTSVLDDKDMNFTEAVDVIKGLAIHEAAHAYSTHWEQFKNFSSRTSEEPIKKALFNIVEDERIERIVGCETPGFSRFLGKTKEYMFDKKYMETIPDEANMTDADKVIG